jgi:carbon monoxide dehydrogenase subunit G
VDLFQKSSVICLARSIVMAGFRLTEWIAASPETIFAYITNVDNYKTIIPSVQEAAQITDGPVGLGTRFRETRLMNGSPATTELAVTTFEPPRHYAATSVVSGVTSTYHYTFTPENAGTRVNLTAEVTAAGLRKVILPVVVGILKKEDGAHLSHLKRAVEASTATPLAHPH